jgi:hypothetical protein
MVILKCFILGLTRCKLFRSPKIFFIKFGCFKNMRCANLIDLTVHRRIANLRQYICRYQFLKFIMNIGNAAINVFKLIVNDHSSKKIFTISIPNIHELSAHRIQYVYCIRHKKI